MGKPHGGLFFHNTKTHGSKQSPELRRTRYSPWENPMVVYFSIIQKHMGRNKIQNYVVYSIHTYIIVHGKNPMVVQFFHNSPRITHMVVLFFPTKKRKHLFFHNRKTHGSRNKVELFIKIPKVIQLLTLTLILTITVLH
uniref:Uncharacterized protein n=1 Tax=Cacopsylla melanoneura TaxID=428564 RepID=A0A8D8QXM1_9HEMI